MNDPDKTIAYGTLRFRAAALSKSSELPAVSLAVPVRFGVYAAMAIVIAVMLMVFTVVAGFGRQIRIEGLILPAAGLQSLQFPRPYRVLRWHVNVGDRVAAGEPIVALAATGESGAEELLNAPGNVTVFDIDTRPVVTDGGGNPVLALLAPEGPLAVVLAIPAAARAQIKPGDTTVVRVEGLKPASGARLVGRVRSVALAPSSLATASASASAAGSAMGYSTVVDLELPATVQPAELLGLAAQVEFTLERRPLYAWLLDPARTLFPE